MILISTILYFLGLLALYFIKIPSLCLLILTVIVLAFSIYGAIKSKIPTASTKTIIISGLLMAALVIVLEVLRQALNIEDPNLEIGKLIISIYRVTGFIVIENLIGKLKVK